MLLATRVLKALLVAWATTGERLYGWLALVLTAIGITQFLWLGR